MSFKVQHLRSHWCSRCNQNKNKGGITIASRLNFEEQSLEYAVSFCSEKDSFVKKIGSLQAQDRFENKSSKYYRRLDLTNKKVNSNYLTMYILADMLIAMQNKPNWANKYIQNLLSY